MQVAFLSGSFPYRPGGGACTFFNPMNQDERWLLASFVPTSCWSAREPGLYTVADASLHTPARQLAWEKDCEDKMKNKRNAMKLKWAIPLFAALAYGASPASAKPILGSDLASFAILGASTVTNVPTSTIVGNVGVSPGSSITGFNSSPGVAVADPQVTGGLVHTTTAMAGRAQGDLTIARTILGLMGAGTLLSADLVGLTIVPGVYTVPAGVSNLTGTVTLDGLGDANAVWVFQMASTLITSPGSVVNVINTGSGAGVYWNVRSSATLDTTTSFQGNILALTSITLNTGATIGCGRALANTGAVTMDTNTVGIGCASGGFGGGSVPEPATLTLLGLGLAGLASQVRRRRAGAGSLRTMA